MHPGPPRIPLTANMVGGGVAFLHQFDVGLYPDDMDVWFADNQWLMWAPPARTVANAPAIPLLGAPGEHR